MKRLAITLTLTVGTVMLLTTGYASANTRPGTHLRFTVLKTSPGPGTVIATGVIHAVGTETSTRNPARPADPYNATFTFADGSLSSNVTPGRPDINFDPTTCVTQITETDHYAVDGGTGRYGGATGAGRTTVHATTIAGRDSDGNCKGPETPPVFALVIIDGAGRLTLR